MEVIPAINCHFGDLECVKNKVLKIQKFSKWVHLDVADGAFTFNKSWSDPEEWGKMAGTLNLEVHLMVENPEKEVGKWLEAGAKRLIVHFETLSEDSLKQIVQMAREKSVAVMLALNPETKISDLPPSFRNLAEYEILAVHPGLAGQKFLPLVLDKIGDLRKEVRSARIQVDGGVTPDVADLVKAKGADALVSASYILGSLDPEKAYQELTR